MKIIISGGGTGGHIYPAIAIADGLKAAHPEAEILFVGALGKMEMEKVPKAGYPIEGLKISGFDRKRMERNLQLPFNLIGSLIKARRIIRDFRPDIAIGVGGYASGPLLFSATRSRVPSLIQEQNSFPGITNRLLSKRVNTICVAYEAAKKHFENEHIVLTGNPVRNDINDLEQKKVEAYRHFGLKEDQPVLFAFGGSLGAKTINDSFLEQRYLLKESNVQLLWQTGRYYYDEIQSSSVARLPNVHPLAFIDRMDLAYALADVVIGRAGALTISELCIVGKAAILVPSPNVAEDHQTKNAQALVEQKAAILVKDEVARNELLKTALNLLKDKELQDQLSKNIRKLAQPDATKRIVAEVLTLIN